MVLERQATKDAGDQWFYCVPEIEQEVGEINKEENTDVDYTYFTVEDLL